MNSVELAKLVIQHFPEDVWTTMVAIAYAESGLNENAEGDSPGLLNSIGFTSSANNAYHWNCAESGTPEDETEGASIGLYQIFLPANHDVVMNLSGINFPTQDIGLTFPVPVNENNVCQLKSWLKIPENNVRVARVIYDRQGLNAWSVYFRPEENPAYLKYVSQAQKAVNQALDEIEPPTEPPTEPPNGEPPILPPLESPNTWLWLLGGGVTALIIGTIIFSQK